MLGGDYTMPNLKESGKTVNSQAAVAQRLPQWPSNITPDDLSQIMTATRIEPDVHDPDRRAG